MTIKELRKRTGLSQSKFAERFHLSMRTLQRWEQNQNEPQEAIVYIYDKPHFRFRRSDGRTEAARKPYIAGNPVEGHR